MNPNETTKPEAEEPEENPRRDLLINGAVVAGLILLFVGGTLFHMGAGCLIVGACLVAAGVVGGLR